MRYWQAFTGLSLALLAACSDDSNSPPRPPEIEATASVAANPHNTISAIVTVAGQDIDSARVRFWKEGGDTATTPSFGFSVADTAIVPVLGLDTLSTYTLEVQLKTGDSQVAFDTLQFTTGEYPAWIPRAVPAGTDTLPGYLLLSYPEGPVISDNAGKILWYRFQPGGVLGSWQAHANGLYTWLGSADSSGFYVFNPQGDQIGRYSCVGYKTRFHDLLVLADGGRWIMCDEEVTMDLSADGGVANAKVTSSIVQHQSPEGIVLFQWRALDHFEVTDVPLESRNGPAVNLTHSNALTIDADGNLLLSSRTLNEITKINVTTGDVMWRLGGLRNEFTFVNDTKGFFEQQHGLRLVSANQIQLLDNGFSAPSRVVRYLIDPTAHTATLEMSFIDAPGTWTLVGGSTQVLSDGRGLVSFGREGRVVEFNATGTKTFEMTGIDDLYVFRAQRISSLYTPGQ